MRRFFARLANLFRMHHAEAELDREINSHLALLGETFERSGMSQEEAARAARRAYGGVEQVKELQREARSFLWLDHFVKDIRYGVRNLMRAPGFTAIAVITLALGMGANTAIFSVVDGVLLRPLAYKDPDRLVTVLHYRTGPVATGNYIDWRDQTHSFAGMGGADYWTPNLTSNRPGDQSPAEHIYALKVTQSLLPLLGVPPLKGRLFRPGEDQVGNEHEAILGYRLWERRFNRDPNVLGQSIILNGEAYSVVGIMPASFQFAPFWATHAELWAPNAFGDSAHERGGNHLRVFARLKPDVTMAQAQADIATVTARLEKQYPATNRGVMVTPLKQNVVGKVETPLLLLLGAVGFVLLIACANVAHMLLARTSDRQKEIAVRVALGAGKVRMLAQFLTENLLLASVGAAAGLLLAFAGIKALLVISPAYLPRVAGVEIDVRVIAFVVVTTVLTALVFGLAPAMHAVAGNISDSLKEGGRGDTDGAQRNKLRSLLVGSEFALAFMLLIGAGLMVRSFYALQSVDPGFNPQNVVSMVVSVAGTAEEPGDKRVVFYRALLQKIRALPGVAAGGAINHLPLAGDFWSRSFEIEGRPKPRPGEAPDAVYRVVIPGYFETMRLPLKTGRLITDSDDARSPHVVIINERAAREHWPGKSPIGERIVIGGRTSDPPEWLTIVGVVADAKQSDWAEPPYPEIYIAGLQTPEFLGTDANSIAAHMNYLTLVARTQGNAKDLAPEIRQVIHSFDRNLTISDVYTMNQVIADATAQPRFETLLFGLFGAVALLLAAVGIYGVMNYSVSRRTREIGIRMSLGASQRDILRIVTQQAIVQAIAGGSLGVMGAILLSKLMSRMLYGVQPHDPTTFAGVVVVLVLAAGTAAVVPSRRAARIEPMRALRNE